MSDFQLTEQQLAFIETFGYLHLPGLLTDRIDHIEAAFESLIQNRGGKDHDGKRRLSVAPFLNHSEYLCSLLDDDRIDGVATGLLGEDYQYNGSDGNYYVGDTDWHSDTRSWPKRPLFYKLAIYLDPVTRDTGALRVIPGSHRCGEGYADVLDRRLINHKSRTRYEGRGYYKATLGADGRHIPAVALESQPGDVVIFNQAIKHSAWGGGDRRRMFTINYSHRHSGEDLDHFLGYVRQHGYTKADVFGDPAGQLLTKATPNRLRHLEQLLDHIPDTSEV